MENQDDNLIEELNKLNFSGKKGQNNRRMFIKECLLGGSQSIHTPYELCHEIIVKNKEICEKNGIIFEEQKFLVLFNVEFVEVLIFDFGISPENVYFIGDSLSEVAFVIRAYGLPFGENNDFENEKRICYNKIGPEFLEIIKMKFDVVIGNPPYNAPKEKSGLKKGKASSIWPSFVDKSFDLSKDNGLICLVHPSTWRKVENKLWDELKNKIIYLEIHGLKDGMKTFEANTRYDFYVATKKEDKDRDATVIDEDGKENKIVLGNWPFLPNGNFSVIQKMLAVGKNETFSPLYSTAYHNQNKHMSREKTGDFIFPCINSTSASNFSVFYSSQNNRGIFGIPKIIIGETGYDEPFVDEKGEYGTTESAFSFLFHNAKEKEDILKSLEFFKSQMKYFFWLGYRIDYKLFRYLKKDFWKEFI